MLENVIKQPPYLHKLILSELQSELLSQHHCSSCDGNVLKIGNNLPFGMLADYMTKCWKGKFLDRNIILDNVLELANSVNNYFKHK